MDVAQAVKDILDGKEVVHKAVLLISFPRIFKMAAVKNYSSFLKAIRYGDLKEPSLLTS